VKKEPAPNPAGERDRRIAEAIERRTKKVDESKPQASDGIDSRIEAAVQRRAAQVGNAGQAAEGGPISYGPGTGSGGLVKGVEYILYRNQMESRIKAAWAWAGANRSLKAVVRFNIMPSGEIVNVHIIEPSGDGAYDASVERALRAVSPLDPPPERYRQEFSTVELEFRPEDIQS
jgi:colicin import membrane protein